MRGGPFSQKEGSRRQHLLAHPPITTAPCSPLEADRADMSDALAVTCHVGRRGACYTSREVLLNPIDEAGDRGLERLDILTLVFL